jgi:hypothetical protein
MNTTPRRYRAFVMDSARWDGFVFRDDDIIISPPPKCGTTWTQMICALLIFQGEPPGPLDQLSPWLDMLTTDRDEIVARLEAQTHRRFIKTHTPLDGLPWDDRVTYVCVGRDPRDVAMSWDNHMANTDIMAMIGARAAAVGLDDVAELLADGPLVHPEDPVERFWAWVDNPNPPTEDVSSLASTLLHLESFWQFRDRSNIVLLHYADLQRDLEGEMRRLARRLGIEVPEERWPTLVELAGFESMKQRADVVVPDVAHGIWRDNARFFNKGASGQWRELLGADGMDRYEARVAALGPLDVVRWAHEGSQGSIASATP